MGPAKTFVIFVAIFVISAEGTLYELFFDNDDVFDICSDIPNNRGIEEVLNFSEFSFEFADGSVICRGNATCAWEGLQSTDRIESRVEVFKFQRGNWQPTPYTIISKDFCQSQFDENSIWYQVWTKNIPVDERKCINNYGHTYHHMDFEGDTVFDFAGRLEGRHKIVFNFAAFDELNQKRPNTICFQIFGEFDKV